GDGDVAARDGGGDVTGGDAAVSQDGGGVGGVVEVRAADDAALDEDVAVVGDADGAARVKGGVVFGSYLNNPAATDAVLADGWFATGDLGALDEDGYLTITGRKKDIIVTSGGKNVSPAVLEDRLRSRPPVGQCLVVGDNRPFVAALITLDPEAVTHWLAVRKLPADTPMSEIVRDPRMRADVQKAVDHANQAVSRAESIRAFTLVEGEFTEENGLLTPSMKVKRQAALAAYAQQIEALYQPLGGGDGQAGGPASGARRRGR
ncbi:AMP-binding protein, partial [Streptomyces sp. PSKA30]